MSADISRVSAIQLSFAPLVGAIELEGSGWRSSMLSMKTAMTCTRHFPRVSFSIVSQPIPLAGTTDTIGNVDAASLFSHSRRLDP